MTFDGGSAAYAVMVGICHTTPMRCFFAALIAVTLMLSGMGGAAMASHGPGGGRFVVIAGTAVTLCQYGGDEDGKNSPLVLHGCDRCALCASPVLPTTDLHPTIEANPRIIILRPIPTSAAAGQALWRVSWPRGPPLS